MHLRHLAIVVTDQLRSREFYEGYFGFDPARARYCDDEVLMLRDADGFTLALKPGPEAEPLPAFFHMGFRVESPQRVTEMLEVMRAAGNPIVEQNIEPAYVSFKCLDPDGYRVEVSWEPEPESSRYP